MSARILVVDDVAMNVKMLADILTFKGYQVITAAGGKEGLVKVESERPDLVLLDVMMPDLNGYEVCRAIRANPATAILPVVMVTALDAGEERVKGLEAGADDFLTKPVNQVELMARVRSLLRVKTLYDQLAELNAGLELRVAEQVAELERLARLKRFVSPRVGELVLSGKIDDPMQTHRREITVAFADLRGFTAFTETAEPEEVMAALRAYHAALGEIIVEHEGTIEHFAGDGVMILFNDPVAVVEHEIAAIRMALDMRDAIARLAAEWRKHGHELGFGVGIASGYATIGAIGFEGRREYGAIGTVCNLASRLCGQAETGQVLVSQRIWGKAEGKVTAEPMGELSLKGLHRPVAVYNVTAFSDKS